MSFDDVMLCRRLPDDQSNFASPGRTPKRETIMSMGRYSENPDENKAEKAQRTWDYLSATDRETISLEEFTRLVNQRHSGAYEPWEFETMLGKLRAGHLH